MIVPSLVPPRMMPSPSLSLSKIKPILYCSAWEAALPVTLTLILSPAETAGRCVTSFDAVAPPVIVQVSVVSDIAPPAEPVRTVVTFSSVDETVVISTYRFRSLPLAGITAQYSVVDHCIPPSLGMWYCVVSPAGWLACEPDSRILYML